MLCCLTIARSIAPFILDSKHTLHAPLSLKIIFPEAVNIFGPWPAGCQGSTGQLLMWQFFLPELSTLSGVNL